MEIKDFSTTSIPKLTDVHLLLNGNVKVLNPETKLPSFKQIFETLIERLDKINIVNCFEVYHSNAIISSNDDDNFDVSISKFQVNVNFPELIIDNETKLGLCLTLEYRKNGSLNVNLALQGIVLACSNGLIIRENIVEKNSGTVNKLGYQSLFNFLNNDILFNAIHNIQNYKNTLKQEIISKDQELWVYGDILQRMHTKRHIVDSNILLASAKYADSAENHFSSKKYNNARSKYDFLQDFTQFMKATEIGRHIEKHIKLTSYFEELEIPDNIKNQSNSSLSATNLLSL